MYLHAGNGRTIRRRDIIGIFDMDNATVSSITRKMLSDMQKQGRVESAAEELPKAFILYRDGDTTKLCLSPLSSSALRGRCDEI
ncbi:MAG: DUF370 domain-containing protein [Clostridia bacterium]|nr:DUF370 domain-containing protein [Clostridia bacterium]